MFVEGEELADDCAGVLEGYAEAGVEEVEHFCVAGGLYRVIGVVWLGIVCCI